MREAGKPVSAGDVTKALGADRREVDKVFAELKKDGAIVSPVRCKWETPSRESLPAPSLKTCPTTGAVHAANSLSRNSIRHKPF